MRSRILASTLALIVFSMLVAVRPAAGSTISVGVAIFGPGSTLTTFTGLPDGTEVSGLTVSGIQFSYSLGLGQLVIDGGPGVTLAAKFRWCVDSAELNDVRQCRIEGGERNGTAVIERDPGIAVGNLLVERA